MAAVIAVRTVIIMVEDNCRRLHDFGACRLRFLDKLILVDLLENDSSRGSFMVCFFVPPRLCASLGFRFINGLRCCLIHYTAYVLINRFRLPIIATLVNFIASASPCMIGLYQIICIILVEDAPWRNTPPKYLSRASR
jgi:hypothetical protein